MRVKFFATYRELTNCKSVELTAPDNVLALLAALAARYPPLGPRLLSPDGSGLSDDAIVMVNGRHIAHLRGVDTPLTEGDTVAVFPLVAGG